MNKFFRFSFFSLLMMFCGSLTAQNTITFGALELENGKQYSDPFDGGDFTVKFAGGGNDGKYYTTGSAIRTYGNGTITVEAKDETKVITKIEFAFDGSNKPNAGDNIVSVGSYDYGTGVWTGSEKSVVFTRPSGSGHWRVKAVTATVSASAGPTVDAPVISGETEFTDKTTVTITTTVEGGKIFYTTDGSNPAESSSAQQYSAPFTLTETTTVKAVVMDVTDAISSVVEKSFVKMLKYKKASNVESGKGYLIVADSRVAKPFTSSYSWLQVEKVTIGDDGIILQANSDKEFLFTQADGGYTITMSDGRQIYQKDAYNNFNADKTPDGGNIWTVAANSDGTFTITNVAMNKWMQFSTKNSSFGSYPDEQDGGILPDLYVLDDGGSVGPNPPVVEVVEVTFDAKEDKSPAQEPGDLSITKSGITMHVTNGVLGSGYKSGDETKIADDYRFYKDAVLTFTAPAGYMITQIDFTSNNNATSSNGLGGFDKPTSGTWNVDGKTGTWTGNASEVAFTATKQVRSILINVTLTSSSGVNPSGIGMGNTLSKYPYAKPELLEKAKELMLQLDENPNEEIEKELAELMKEVARSHALAEGLPDAEDLTELLGEWTTEIFTNGDGFEDGESFTAEGSDFIARVYQTIELPAGHYMLTATGRGKRYATIAENIEELLQVMAINNDGLGRYKSIARTDRDGGVYGEGWDDASNFFTMTGDGEAVIGARFIPLFGTESWGEMANFRLVRLGDAVRFIDCWQDFNNDAAEYIDVILHRPLNEGEWNSLVVPFNLSGTAIREKFGEGSAIAEFTGVDKSGTVALFKTVKTKDEEKVFVPANKPVLIKPAKVAPSNMYTFKGIKMERTVPSVVKQGNFTLTGYYNYTKTPVNGGYGFDLVDKDGIWTALTTSAVLMPNEDAELTAVKVDDQLIWSAPTDDDVNAALVIRIVGSLVEFGDNSTTQIRDIEVAGQKTGMVYNMAGQRVKTIRQKGFYIVDGKKVVIK